MQKIFEEMNCAELKKMCKIKGINNILCFGESCLRLGSWIAVPRI